MPIYSLQVRRPVHWILSTGDTAEVAMPSSILAGWSILSPTTNLPEDPERSISLEPLIDGRCLVSTTRLDFRTPADDPDVAMPIAEQILRWLRFVSGQSQVGKNLLAHQIFPDGSVGPAIEVPFGAEPLAVPRTDIVESAITLTRLTSALSRSPGMEVPVYAEVMLDAIEAGAFSDYRKAILYSAIAVETMAATRNDELYEQTLKTQPNDLRLVSRALAGGVVERNDPVFERLQEGVKGNFRMLIHELPLYSTRRSMLSDDEALYASVMDLHKARNHLVHRGDVDPSLRHSVDYEGSKRAQRTAISAFSWFGAQGRYFTIHGFGYDAG